MTSMMMTTTMFLLMLIVSRTDARATVQSGAKVDDDSPVLYRDVKVRMSADEVNGESSRLHYRAGGVSSQQIKEIVDHHNKLRAAEGASNMEVLRWNKKLAELAQKWSDRCEFEHGQPAFDQASVGYEKLGQNLYVNSDLSKGVTAGVQAWFDEKSDYTYDNMACRPRKQCGHYTQVVWGTTKEVGCGLTKCASIAGMKNANYLVCNYGPPGNWNGQKPFKKGAACSSCDSGKFFCSNNLCDSLCSSAGQGSTCKCQAQCGKCGTKTNDCKCECKPGWTGVACNEECRDKHHYCGGNPGWPKSWCDTAHQYVLDNCPKFCGLCKAASGQTCSLKSWAWRIASEATNERYANDSDEDDNDDDDKLLGQQDQPPAPQQQQPQSGLVSALNNLREQLETMRR